MAKKITDLMLASIIGFFAFAFMAAFFVDADSLFTVNNNLGSDIDTISAQGVASYYDTEKNIWSVTYTNATFDIKESEFYDKRGISEAGILGRDQPSTIKTAMLGYFDKIKAHPLIYTALASLIITSGIFLFLRSIRGEGGI